MESQREFRLGEWQVTPLRGVLHGDAGTRRLTPKAMDVLLCLARRHGHVVERDTLLDEVWDGRAVSDEPLNKCIAELRRQLGDDRGAPSYIETIPKRGYRLIADYAPIGKADTAGDSPAAGRRQNRLRQGAIVVVVLLAVFLAGRYTLRDASRPGESVAVAVLPFEVLSSAEAKEYFADGIHEELIATLSRNRLLDVRSRTSTLRYRGTEESLPNIASALGVDAIVEGTVRQEGDQVRVTAQLVDAIADSHLWSGIYEETLTVAELFAIQNQIAREISTALEVTLTSPVTVDTDDDLPTGNIAAYDHFMLGKYHYRRQLPGDIEMSVNNFEAAVALDPDFADAWDWLAYAYNHAATGVGYLSPHEAYPKARTAALRALEIQPDLATAVSILGYIRAVYDWDWVGAEADMRRAIELAPNDSGTVWSLAHVLAMLGRHDEAIRLTTEFAQSYPAVGRNHREVANRMLDAGRYEEALEWLQKAAERGAERAQVEDTAGIVLFAMGRNAEALEKFEYAVDAKQRAPGTVARLAFLYAASGRDADAAALVSELEERLASEPITALTMATARMGLGDRTAALELLEQAARDRDRGTLSIRTDPFFRDLHREPRFEALVDQLGIPE